MNQAERDRMEAELRKSSEAYVGYPRAKAKRSTQDREAAKNVPIDLARGAVSGVLGAPGDIEKFGRELINWSFGPGGVRVNPEAVLATSEDVEQKLPLRPKEQTPVGRAATGLGQLAGGAYMGPGSPLKALAGVPGALKHGAQEFAHASALGAPHAIKPKGGNWISGAIEKATGPLKPRGPTNRDEALILGGLWPEFVETPQGRAFMNENAAVSDWIDKKLNRYVQNEMATPDDPVLKAGEKFLTEEKPKLIADKEKQLAKARADLEKAQRERGVSPEMLTRSQARVRELEKDLAIIEARTGFHSTFEPSYHPYLEKERAEAGFPPKGVATTEQGKLWEESTDSAIGNYSAGDWMKNRYKSSEQMLKDNPWLGKVAPESKVYGTYQGKFPEGPGSLKLQHLVDELANATNPASGLPKELLIDPAKLQKMSVPDVVRHVDMVNAWRAGQKAEADLARAGNIATHTFKEYPEEGLKWVELKAPKNAEPIDDGFGNMSSPGYEELEDALKYEGEMLQHCVGGYCPDVFEGRSRIFSLRDSKGKPHATVEVRLPTELSVEELRKKVPLAEAKLIEAEAKRQIGKSEKSLPHTYGLGTFQAFYRALSKEAAKARPDVFNVENIIQIKGLRNAAPDEKYQPYIQDFINSQKWGNVKDLENAGLKWKTSDIFTPEEVTQIESSGAKVPDYMTDAQKKQLVDTLNAPPPAPEVKEQPMLQGFYRGYAGERGNPEEVFASPQRAVAEYYANKRAVQTGGEPNIEMVLADPSAGKAYGHSTMGTGAEPPLTTMARKLAAEDVKSTTPLGSLREQNLQKFVEPSVEQGRFYHGTGEDIREFDPQAGELGYDVPTFVSSSPEFSSGFYNRRPSTADELWESGVTQEFPQYGANVMPVHVQVRNPFSAQNPQHLEALLNEMHGTGFFKRPFVRDPAQLEKLIREGNWGALEDPDALELIKKLGHDAFYTQEGNVKNLGIFDPRRIKSAIGNRGTYDIKEPDITKAEGGSVSTPDDFTAPDMSDGGSFFPDPDYMRMITQQR